jgi:lysine 2,3-aminomutase
MTEQTNSDDRIGDDNIQDLNSIWKNLLSQSIKSPKELCEARQDLFYDMLPDVREKYFNDLEEVCKTYPMRITPHYLSLIKKRGDPLYLHEVPSIKEITDIFGEEDPLFEESEHQARKGVPSILTHRHDDRVLMYRSNTCPTYCRDCTRKRKVEDPKRQPQPEEIRQSLEYIASHPEIIDVIISGGDPLMLADSTLEKTIKDIYDILSQRKNSRIRIGTRMPVVLPQRITSALCNMLKKYHPIYMNLHFDHPNEITPESKKACEMLADAGIPLGNQTVLAKGINDDIKVLKELFQGLVAMRVRPYYLYQCDPVRGVNHFRTRVEKSLEIYEGLKRLDSSGLEIPKFVIDAPGGGGKIQLLPTTYKITDKEVILENYDGKTYIYPQVEKKE